LKRTTYYGVITPARGVFMTTEMDNTVNITDAAAHKIYELIQEEDNLKLNLRVFLTGGGCSGLQYNFTFDEDIKDDDHVFTKDKVKLLVDVHSFHYLRGATIDYKEDVQGARFVIRNPNAKTTCGCGSSFAPEE